MAWETTLLPASFRGVAFEVVSTSDDIERAIVIHEYPFVDGGDVDDMGRVARRISMTAVFYGDDYEIRLQEFLDTIDIPGSGELIHPIFGTMQVQAGRSNVPHDASTPDYTKITLEFIEKGLNTRLFDRVLPMQTVDAINLAADNALDATTSQFGIDFAKAISFPATLRDKLSADMLGVMGNMRTYCDQILGARSWLSSGAYYLNNPIAFVDDLSSGLVSRLQGIFSPMDLRLGYSGISSSSNASSTSVPTIAASPTTRLSRSAIPVAA